MFRLIIRLNGTVRGWLALAFLSTSLHCFELDAEYVADLGVESLEVAYLLQEGDDVDLSRQRLPCRCKHAFFPSETTARQAKAPLAEHCVASLG